MNAHGLAISSNTNSAGASLALPLSYYILEKKSFPSNWARGLRIAIPKGQNQGWHDLGRGGLNRGLNPV